MADHGSGRCQDLPPNIAWCIHSTLIQSPGSGAMKKQITDEFKHIYVHSYAHTRTRVQPIITL